MKKLIAILLLVTKLVNAQTSITFSVPPNSEFYVISNDVFRTTDCDDVTCKYIEVVNNKDSIVVVELPLSTDKIVYIEYSKVGGKKIMSKSSVESYYCYLEPNKKYTAKIEYGKDFIIINADGSGTCLAEMLLLKKMVDSKIFFINEIFGFDMWKDTSGYLFQYLREYHNPPTSTLDTIHFLNLHNKKMQMLDAAYKASSISKEFYDYFTQFFHFLYLYNINYSIDDTNDKSNIHYRGFSSEKELLDIINNPTLLKYPTYVDFMISYIRIERKKLQKEGRNKDFGVDYDIANERLTGANRNYFLYKILNYPYFKNQTNYKAYTQKFIRSCDEKKYIEPFLNKQTLYNQTTTLLEDINGNKINLTNLLKQYKDKQVYVDLWASWCGPCRAAFKDSRTLEQKHKEGDIVFLYLSIDDNKTAWKKAMTDEKLSPQYSFLITNGKSSDFAKYIDLQSIPRYILLDKKGVINSLDAAHPGVLLQQNF